MAVAGLRRVLSVLDMPVGPPEPDDPIPLPQGQLQIDVRDVTFAYRSRTDQSSDTAVLKHLDFTIPAGQQVALVGSTGSGKTTLGRLIARFADPTIGEIELGGVPAAPGQPRRTAQPARGGVAGAVPLRRHGRGERCVRLGTTPRRSTSNASSPTSVYRTGSTRCPTGSQTRVGERGDQLSAGERQLVALLRAGLADPDVLILDEATSSVDALTEVRIARALERLAATRTTIAIAHRLSTAARADRVLVLDHGRLVEDGHHDELITQRRRLPTAVRRVGLGDDGLRPGRTSRPDQSTATPNGSGPLTSRITQSIASRSTWLWALNACVGARLDVVDADAFRTVGVVGAGPDEPDEHRVVGRAVTGVGEHAGHGGARPLEFAFGDCDVVRLRVQVVVVDIEHHHRQQDAHGRGDERARPGCQADDGEGPTGARFPRPSHIRSNRTRQRGALRRLRPRPRTASTRSRSPRCRAPSPRCPWRRSAPSPVGAARSAWV